LRHLLNTMLLLLLSGLLLTAGCSSDEARSFASGSSVAPDRSGAEASGEFSAAITLCRKVSRKSGRPIGAGDSFKMAGKSYVNALVDFRGVQPGRTYVVHLVWVRPDGKAIFRKYAEVVQTVQEDDSFRTVIRWLDGVDLHKVKRDTLTSEEPVFTLQSRLNISNKKKRVPGQYALRVYLDRRLLLARSFMVEGEPPALDE